MVLATSIVCLHWSASHKAMPRLFHIWYHQSNWFYGINVHVDYLKSTSKQQRTGMCIDMQRDIDNSKRKWTSQSFALKFFLSPPNLDWVSATVQRSVLMIILGCSLKSFHSSNKLYRNDWLHDVFWFNCSQLDLML